ncbi:hypothetical protein ACKVMT_07055 [Halobacteriales archaeon Cl-PHB]
MATSTASRGIGSNLVLLLVTALGAAAGFVALGDLVSPYLAAGGFAVFAALLYGVYDSGDEISVTFALSLVAVVLLLVEFVVPASIVAMVPGSGYLDSVAPVQFAVVTAGVILAFWIYDVRFNERAKRPETMMERLMSRIEDLFAHYVKMTRVAFLAGIGLGLIILDQLGVLTGELAGIVAGAPYLAGQIGTIILGYLTMGGDVPYVEAVPVVGEIGAQGFLWLAAIGLVVAVGVDYAD